MKLGVEAGKAFTINVRVALRGRERCVSKEFLDGSEVCTPLDEMSREGMTQSVRAQCAFKPNFSSPLSEDSPSSVSI